MRDRHRRSFWTLLWEGFKENWWIRPRPFDWHEEYRQNNADLDKISGVSEYSRGTIPHVDATLAQVWRQYPIAHNDANHLADCEVDEDFERLLDEH